MAATVLGVRCPPGCEVREASGKGKGLFATAKWEAGAQVFSEKPLFAMQHTENRRVVAACACCCGFVGRVGSQLDALFRGAYTRQLFGDSHFEPLLSAVSSYLHRWDTELLAALSQEPPGSGVVTCSQGCGELYCSEACRDAHFGHSHNLLCVGLIENEDHPLLQFKLHALQHTDTLLLAAQVLANLVNRARSDGGVPALRGLIAELKTLCHAPFPQVCRPPRGQVKDAEFLARTDAWIAEAARLLQAALGPHAQAETAVLFERGPALLSEVLGLFEYNNITVQVASPLASFFAGKAQELAAIRERDAAAAAELQAVELLLRGKEHFMRRAWGEETTGICEDAAGGGSSARRPPSAQEAEAEVEQMSLEQLLQAAWPTMYGDALSVSTSLTNHSCAPNLKIKFTGNNACLTAISLKPVAEGEELCYSYIQEGAGVKARQRQLLHWGFTCQCERCLQEDAGSARKVRRQRLK